MSFTIEGVLTRIDPKEPKVPVVMDSPHSGSNYPADLKELLAEDIKLIDIRRTEDAYVDELYEDGIFEQGAYYLKAEFPRGYVDTNRAETDFDPRFIDGTPLSKLNPGEKSRMGKGVCWTLTKTGKPIYDRKFTPQEFQARIEKYHRPYHEEINRMVRDTRDKFGLCYHVNLHSMPSFAEKNHPDAAGSRRADFVISDREGDTCDPAFVSLVAQKLNDMGYSVGINDPYKGAELVRMTGHPNEGLHSLQIEIRRDLYMDEHSLVKNSNFAKLQADLKALTKEICSYAQDQAMKLAAKQANTLESKEGKPSKALKNSSRHLQPK